MTVSDRLTSLIDLCRRSELRDPLKDNGSDDAHLLASGLRFSFESMVAASRLIRDLPLQAMPLARAVFECGVRLRWASIMPQGWDRLRAYYAASDLKYIREPVTKGRFVTPDHFAREERSLSLSVAKASGHPLPESVQGSLGEIAARDMLIPGAKEDADLLYADVYRITSRVVHGQLLSNVGVLDARVLIVGCARGAFLTIQAVSEYVGNDFASTIAMPIVAAAIENCPEDFNPQEVEV